MSRRSVRREQRHGISRRTFLMRFGAAAAALQSRTPLHALAPDSASPFLLEGDAGTITSLRFRGDRFPTDYIEPGQNLGDIGVVWRRPGGDWQAFDSSLARAQAIAPDQRLDPAPHPVLGPAPAPAVRQSLPMRVGAFGSRHTLSDAAGPALEVRLRLVPAGMGLRWSVKVRNLAAQPIEIGDLVLPLPMHTFFRGDGVPTASVLKHSFVSGHGSFLFWIRSNSVGPYLMLTPEANTALEFWDRTEVRKATPASKAMPGNEALAPIYRVYVHSLAQGTKVAAAGGRWRQPYTSLTVAPRGSRGSHHEYGFRFSWASSYDEVRQTLADRGLLDIEVAPGMTVPTDLFTVVAFRSRNIVSTLVAEHSQDTVIEPLGRRGDYQLFRLRFSRLGENLINVHQHDGRVTRLEFFSTEPLETLIHKRGAFIAGHQHTDPAKWYRGLLSEWNMDSGVMLSPDNYDRIKGWRIYEVTCDDPGLSKPAMLATKLAEYPDQAQATALDDYIEHFVWGGLQRTTEESDSYGIYGILDWKRNRDSPDPGDKGRRHLWRPYDYPHIVVMYWGMYRLARDFPGIQTRLTRAQYLERAYGTALALFTVPRRIIDWQAYQIGFYNEVVIPALISELDAVGKTSWASTLRKEWEQKVQYFLTGGPNLFGSEYAFDSTGFESTEAIARYVRDQPLPQGVTAAQARAFARLQMQANLFCRGVLEKAYYYYGSDYRAEGGDAFTLTYMAQLGGWAVLDHALHDGSVPDATIRLGFASFLSAWALMNTGTASSGYGFWFPGKDNDGGTGGGFEPSAMSTTWLGQPNHRGPWYYSSEADIGYCGALRTAATIIADDPVFGLFCFGGTMQASGEALHIIPRDGVRRRIHLRAAGHHIDLEVSGARFVSDRPAIWSAANDSLRFVLEREPLSTGDVTLRIEGLLGERYILHTPQEELHLSGTDMKLAALKLPGLSGTFEFERAHPSNA